MASAARQLLRADALLSEELARLHATQAGMTPATLAAVRSVLESLVDDDELDPGVCAEAKAVLDELTGRVRPTRRVGGLAVRVARLHAA